jgi:hypothetical protein
VLDAQLAQDESGPDLSLTNLYQELCAEVRSMETMALPAEIAACIEDKDASPQSLTRSLQSVVDRSRAQSSGVAGSGAGVLRGAGFEQAVLAHLGTMAEAMTGIAGALGAKPKAVRAALQVLNSAEVGDDASDDEEEEEPVSVHMHKERS